jgi:proline racemase
MEGNGMFEAARFLSVVDTHTMGEPTRIVTHGVPHIPGSSVAEQRLAFMRDFDDIRRAVVQEPRGHRDMFAVALVHPCDPAADLGVIYMDCGGYLNMCVHGTIGLVTAGLSLGFLAPRNPVVLETPSGLVSARWRRDEAYGLLVSVRNVPAFVAIEHVCVSVEGGELWADIVFAGNFFALVAAKQLGRPVTLAEAPYWQDLATKILAQLNQQVKVKHPGVPGANRIDLVEFYDEQSPTRYKNITVFGRGQFDRSPCGTGTTAKLALLHHQGRLRIGERVESFSVLDTRFEAEVVETTMVNGYSAVVCEITGAAYITGMGSLVLQERDPFCYGFSLDSPAS